MENAEPNEFVNYKIIESIYSIDDFNFYRAIDLRNKNSVFLKIANNPSKDTIARFHNDFNKGSLFDSEYILKYIELKDIDDKLAIILEDFNGIRLDSIIPPKGFDNIEFLKIALQLTAGLEVMHDKSIMHKDIRPENILRDAETNIIKYLNFEYASYFKRERGLGINSNLPEDMYFYISPEQTDNMNYFVDHRTDFYSLGVVFYQLLTNKLPFQGDDFLEIVHKHIARKAVLVTNHKKDISWQISKVIEKLLAKEVNDRYQNSSDLRNDLEECHIALQGSKFRRKKYYASKLFITSQFFGRNIELSQIKNMLDRITKSNAEVLFMSGCSGIGKTSLIKKFAKNNVHLIEGKFNKVGKELAYGPITKAFDDFLLNVGIAKLAVSAMKDLNILLEVIPSLSKFVKIEPKKLNLGHIERKQKLYLAFQKFVQIIANSFNPLVLFIDDLQWADPNTLDLLKFIITNKKLDNFLFISAFRDNEICHNQYAREFIESIKASDVIVNELILTSLSLLDFNRLISNSLRCDESSVGDLSSLLHTKTNGNPFFVKILLQDLYEKKILFFNETQKTWQWNVNKINDIDDVGMYALQEKFKALDLQEIDLLKIMSCFGNTEYLCTLDILARLITDVNVNLILEKMLCQDLLYYRNDSYHFSHDSIREFLQRLLNEKEREQIHLKIGRLLLKNNDDVVAIAEHLSPSYRLITSADELLSLAQISYKAGMKVRATTAYSNMERYLSMGAKCLRENCWRNNYDLSFNIYRSLAEAKYLLGKFDECEKLVKQVVANARTDLDKAKVYNLLIVQYTMQAKYDEAIEIGMKSLSLLGLALSDDNEITDFIGKNKNKDIASLIELPKLEDHEKSVEMEVLNNLFAVTYIKKSKLFPVIGSTMVQISLQSGNSIYSPLGYAIHAITLTSLDRYEEAYEFSLLAVKLACKFKIDSQICKTLHMFSHLYHWKKPFKDIKEFYKECYVAGIKAGDFQYIGYVMVIKMLSCFVENKRLHNILKECNDYFEFAQKVKHQHLIAVLEVVKLNIFTFLEEKHAENKMADVINDMGQQDEIIVDLLNSILAMQGNYINGKKINFESVENVQHKLLYITGSVLEVIFNFYQSLILAAAYKLHPKQEYLIQVEANQKRMKVWTDNCEENFLNKYLLVQAEIANIKGNKLAAIELYNSSINIAKKYNYILEVAIANELLCTYFLSFNEYKYAKIHANEAYEYYKEWGANVKVETFKKEYFELLNGDKLTLEENLNKNIKLNLATINKAAMAISDEIDLKFFLKKMMKIIMENAGAEDGYLMLKKGNDFFIEAEYHMVDNQSIVLQAIPYKQSDKLAHGIVKKVLLSNHEVVLNDVPNNEEFSKDLFVKQNKCKSIYCMPILYQFKIKGLLYLSNNLLTNVFTAERQRILNLLSAQIAISLENAYKYQEVIDGYSTLFHNVPVAVWRSDYLKLLTYLDEINFKNIPDIEEYLEKNLKFIEKVARYIYVEGGNSEFRRLYAVSDAKSFVTDMLNSPGKKTLIQIIKNILIAIYYEEESLRFELDFHLHVNKVKYFICYWNRYFDYKTNLYSKALTFAVDITELKEAYNKQREHELQMQAIQMQQENRARFISDLCHEIRTPLHGICGNIQALQESIEKAYYTEKIDSIINNINECIENQLTILDYSADGAKIDEGILKLEVQPAKIKANLLSIISIFNANAKEKGLKIVFNIPLEEIYVYIDIIRFKQIVTNLLDNAIKFTNYGIITLSLNILYIVKNKIKFELSVADTGIGLTKEEQERLFTRFKKLNSNGSNKFGGTGLGLYISKKLANLMQGDVTVKSEKGKGSTFTVVMECDVVEKQHDNFNVNNKPVKEVDDLNILVVDDNEINRKIFEIFLKHTPYRCFFAKTGKEALDIFNKENLDIIFMDIIMPEMDGCEATFAIRKIEEEKELPRIPIIGLSALTQEEDTKRALAAGVDVYLTKPFTQEALLEIILKCIAKKTNKNK